MFIYYVPSSTVPAILGRRLTSSLEVAKVAEVAEDAYVNDTCVDFEPLDTRPLSLACSLDQECKCWSTI